jgi:RNase P/RNase MRP subunit POP5
MVHHRNRFLTVRVEWAADQPVRSTSAQMLMAQLRASVGDLHGDFGAGCALPSLSMRFFDPNSGVGTVRVDREFADVVRTSAVLVTILDQREARLRVLHVAGSMRRCKAVLRRGLDAHLSHSLAGSAKGPPPPRAREEALRQHREAVADLERAQL